MNSFQLLEVFGVLLIITCQAYIFMKTKARIDTLKTVFPDVGNFEVIKTGLHHNELNRYSSPAAQNKTDTDQQLYVDLIYKKQDGNSITDKIVHTLNTYLIRNRGAASDFHLMKDVVERNTDAIEEDINQTISQPLYLGLLGTFLGIVIGLFQISGVDFSDNPAALDQAISLLLGGVKIAMIASFTGLLLTVVANGYLMKGAKALTEEKKNDFYTFLQTELLPLLNQNINTTLFSLQSNLHKFNEEFKHNLDKLHSVMGKNHDALVAQEKILTTLDSMDINEFAKANVKILRELQLSTEKFAAFNDSLGHINSLVSQTAQYTGKLDSMLERTDNFHRLGKNILAMFSQNEELMKFLQEHYNSLDESRQMISHAVNNVGNTLDVSLNLLKDFTQQRINEVQQITLKEISLMRDQYPEKWNNLDYLSKLSNDLADIKMSNAAQVERITNELKNLNNNIQIASQNKQRNKTWHRTWERIKKRFGFKN